MSFSTFGNLCHRPTCAPKVKARCWDSEAGRGLGPQRLQKLLAEWGAHIFILFNCCMGFLLDAAVVQSLSCGWIFAIPWTLTLQATLSSTISVSCSNSCLLNQWCYLTISSSVVPFSSCLQSFPASGFFPMSQLFTSRSQSIGASASASDLFPLGLTSLILQSKWLSRVFSNTIVRKHHFFSAQLSLWSNSYIHTWLLEEP